MRTNEMAIVMLKYCQGEDVQRRAKDVYSDWEDVKNPLWNWDMFEYRVKPKEEKPKRMTNMQLAEWCAKGNGTWSHEPSKFRSRYHYFWFSERAENEEVCPSIIIRPWGSDEWVAPTIDIYERDCCGRKA